LALTALRKDVEVPQRGDSLFGVTVAGSHERFPSIHKMTCLRARPGPTPVTRLEWRFIDLDATNDAR
jgi:hypothetical protein